MVQWRHELQKSSDKIIFKIKTVYDTKRKLHQWVLINTTLVSRVGWLDFSIVTTSRWSSHPLFFIEFGKIRSGFSEIFFFFFTSPRIEMEISGGGGIYLFPSCLMLTSCLSLGRLFSFKLRSMLITRMEKFSSSDAIEKIKKNKN